MQGHKSPGILVAEITMSRMSHDGAFLLLEGKDDVRFWRSRRHSNCELVDGEGKPNVVGAVRRIDTARIPGALGIVDSDCELPTSPRAESDNLLYTDAHDLECLLCRSPALDKVLAEHGDAAKIRQFEHDTGIDVRTALLERALVFGRLRWAARARPAIALRGMAVPRLVDEETWTVDGERLIRETVSDADARAAVRMRLAQLPDADPWYVAHGHDMVEILRTGLREVLGNLPVRVEAQDVAGLLRAGMSPEALRETGLGAGVYSWQAANRPYSVLAD